MSTGLVVDMFAGPGGWAEGMRRLRLAEVGIEIDLTVCATRRAAGHRTICADVASFPIGPLIGRTAGLIASPPCPLFSAAGSGAGRVVLDDLGQLTRALLAGCWWSTHHSHITRKLYVWHLKTGKSRTQAMIAAHNDARQVGLSLEPARWIARLQPRWVAMEQVPPVLDLWGAYVDGLRALGYSAWCGMLNAANYGIAQTRQRAFLVASRDRPAIPPAPTHARYPHRTLFGPTQEPWVLMAEALGWVGALDRRQQTRGSASPVVPVEEIAPTLTGTAGAKGQWVVRAGTNSMVTGRTRQDCQPYERTIERPAPVIDHKAGKWRLMPGGQQHRQRPTKPRPADAPAPTLAFGHDTARWWQRPATTLAGDPRVFPPGGHIAHDGRDNTRSVPRSETDMRLELADALVLQSFRPDYPIQGTKGQQFQQVGNAVPPHLAAQILAAITGLDPEPAEAG